MNKKIRHEFKSNGAQIEIPIKKTDDLKRIADALESIADSLRDSPKNNMLGY